MGSPCQPGIPNGIRHNNEAPCTGGGSFSFRGTLYQDTCGVRQAPLEDCPGNCPSPSPPPLRFWQIDSYGGANSGCADPIARCWLANGLVDFGIGSEPGHWFLFGTDWTDAGIDGCINQTGNPVHRTVAEFSFVHGGSIGTEGTVDHSSWYLIAAVDETGGYDFDRVRGAGTPAIGGCSAADVRVRPVPAPTIDGRDPLDCTGNGSPTFGDDNEGGDPDYFDITVDLSDPTPAYFNEVGLNDPSWRLIEGFEILFRTGAEPTSSDECDWTPVRNPANPDAELGTVPYGTRRVVVSLERTFPPVDHWLAVRLVYTDCSVNGSRVLNPACTVPRPIGRAPLGSKVSSHCGPVAQPV